jgi:hypothetical protein
MKNTLRNDHYRTFKYVLILKKILFFLKNLKLVYLTISNIVFRSSTSADKTISTI